MELIVRGALELHNARFVDKSLSLLDKRSLIYARGCDELLLKVSIVRLLQDNI